MANIHSSAIVAPEAILEDDVEVGPYAVVHPNVKVGAGSCIGAYCELGLPTALAKSPVLDIGASSTIRSHSVIYAGSQVGAGLTTGHYVTIRENSAIGEGFQLGNRGDVQGDCTIGNFTRTHADVHIGKKSIIGNGVWLFPEVLLTNDPNPPSEELIGVTIGDYAVVAAKVLLMPGAHIGGDSVISVGSVVAGNIPAGKVAKGNPAKVVCDASILRMHSSPSKHAYPWRRRFHRGYPEELVREWLEEFED